MIVGTSMFKMGGSAYFSPEFPRGGLAATFSVDVQNMTGSPTLTIKVEHRNEEDTTFSELGSFDNITTTGSPSKDLTGCKEILRFRFEFAAGDDAADGVHLLVQAPAWRPY